MHTRFLLLLLGILVLSACGKGLGDGIPTMGPVAEGADGGGAPYPDVRLRASTNCATIGEVVTFTLDLVNDTAGPLTWPEYAPLDIVLVPAQRGSAPVRIRRWSDTPHYPHRMNPILQPGERRTYTWPWVAEAVYGPAMGVSALVFDFDHNAMVKVYVGVDLRLLPNGSIACAEMQR